MLTTTGWTHSGTHIHTSLRITGNIIGDPLTSCMLPLLIYEYEKHSHTAAVVDVIFHWEEQIWTPRMFCWSPWRILAVFVCRKPWKSDDVAWVDCSYHFVYLTMTQGKTGIVFMLPNYRLHSVPAAYRWQQQLMSPSSTYLSQEKTSHFLLSVPELCFILHLLSIYAFKVTLSFKNVMHG